MRVMSIDDLFRLARERSGAEPDRQDKLPPNPDIVARQLLDARAELDRPCPFQPGDLIVPRARNAFCKPGLGLGLVLRVLEHPTMTANNIGQVADMVAAFRSDSGNIAPLFVPSHAFEPYTGPVAPAA